MPKAIITSLGIFFLLGFSAVAKTNSNMRKEIERFQLFSLPNTEIRHLSSKTNGISYKLYFSIPASYYQIPQKKYQVLFLLDADYSFALAKQIVEHLSDRRKLPETIMVGIAYDGPLKYRENRTRDYTPSFVADGGYGPEFQKHSGGAEKFAKFMRAELLPYVSQEFRIGKKAIVGHSFGGLFVSWVYLKHPDLFDQHISISPSLWYDNRMIFKIKPTSESTKKGLYLAIGEKENGGEYRMVDDTKKFYEQLQNQKTKVSMNVFAEENHDTVFPAALTRGLTTLLQEKI